MKILILGCSGLIGSTLFRVMFEDPSLEVIGTTRSKNSITKLTETYVNNIITGVDIVDEQILLEIIQSKKPNVIINCIGITKHVDEINNYLGVIKINTTFPHKLAKLCETFSARLIHISTDCVFSGKGGFYSENDPTDSTDLYGKSKALGEIVYGENITIRTSTIGHELSTNNGLLNWFIKQKVRCKGFGNAIFSGVPTVVLAQIIRDYILPRKDLRGLYHIAASPINKYDLLMLIAEIYKKKINIELDRSFKIDRSLNAAKFNSATGYNPPGWRELIEIMFHYQ